MTLDMDNISKSFVKPLHYKGVKTFVDDDEDDRQKWHQEWAKLLAMTWTGYKPISQKL